jgi:hypothetical protein
MVGAPADAMASTLPGAVFVYSMSAGFSSPQQTIASPAPSDDDFFGYSIALGQQVAFVGTKSSGTMKWRLYICKGLV